MLEFFYDPILRGPTIGSILMGVAASLVGVLVFLRKRSLLGEALSHATYPGVTLAIIVSAFFGLGEWTGVLILFFAFLFSLVGYYVIHLLETKLKVAPDAALCFVLATFFGVGITIASYIQFTHAVEYRKIQSYLYGQAATMGDFHILLYGGFALGLILFVFLFFKELQVLSFDRFYAKTVGLALPVIDFFVFAIMGLVIVLGIRTVGVVLMSAMLIAPAVSARQFSHKLSSMFTISALFGALSGFLGNYLSINLVPLVSSLFPGWKASLPTGPMIVMVASSFALFSLLFAPKRGLCIRYLRIIHFRWIRVEENLLKTLWRGKGEVSFKELISAQLLPRWTLWLAMQRLKSLGLVAKTKGGTLHLTEEGERRGGRIIRLHRLWEVYLVDYLGMGAEKVHKSAEEMEHILTEEIERELTALLDDPKHDPHKQPIPAQNEVMNRGLL